jgi:preprotein translocase subunit YajC
MHVLSIVAASSGGGSIVSLLFLPLIFVAMYFLMIRPQRRRQRDAAQLQRSIDVGDEIMTTSGVYGFVTGFDGDIAWLEIDDNVQIRVARAAIQRRVDTTQTAAEDAAEPGARPRQTKIDDASIEHVEHVDGDATK